MEIVVKNENVKGKLCAFVYLVADGYEMRIGYLDAYHNLHFYIKK